MLCAWLAVSPAPTLLHGTRIHEWLACGKPLDMDTIVTEYEIIFSGFRRKIHRCVVRFPYKCVVADESGKDGKDEVV